LSGVADPTPGLKINFSQKLYVEKELGKIDLANQFILVKLLEVLCENQGIAVSKEEIVRRLWKENYDPAQHDNRIYVNIKRLRTLIEPDTENPKYLFRSADGYFVADPTQIEVAFK
jgi:DNA-binding winged helix-turn-helix (wHTH) protein